MKWLNGLLEIIRFDSGPHFRRSFPVTSAFPLPRLLRTLLSSVGRRLCFFRWSTSAKTLSRGIRKPSFFISLRVSIPQYWLGLFLSWWCRSSFIGKPAGCSSLSLFDGRPLAVRKYRFWRTLTWGFCREWEGTWQVWRSLFCWHWAIAWYDSWVSFYYSGRITWQGHWSSTKEACM